MAGAPEVGAARVFVVVNAKSGNSSPEQVREAWKASNPENDAESRIHDVVEGEDILDIVREAVAQGYDTVAAAGGDGTVSAVANGLIGTEARLGIIPLGTANVLRRELAIPLALADACALLQGPNATTHIDAMKVKGKHYFTQIGIGVDAVMIRDTTVEHKRWLETGRISGRRRPGSSGFSHTGSRSRPTTAEPVREPYKWYWPTAAAWAPRACAWGPEVEVDDGKIDVCILRAQTLLNFLSVGWSVVRGRHKQDRNIQLLIAERAVAVHTDRPLPVQGDGEVIGETPLEVQVVPRAVPVIVPSDRGKR